MMKTDPNSHHDKEGQLADDQRWRRLFENIRRIALKKSDAMINDLFADEEEFDRDARILRTLMGSAEIAARMKRQDEKDDSLNEERPEPRPRTDEEIREIYRRVAGVVDALEREERAELASQRKDQTDRSDHARTRRGKGMAEPCA